MAGVAFFFPLFYLVMSSLKEQIQILTVPPIFVFAPHFENFAKELLGAAGKYTWNSVFFATASTLFALTAGLPAAYSLSRYKLGGGRIDLTFFILAFRMIPPIVGVIPTFLLMNWLGLIDTPAAIILAYTCLNVPLVVWMSKGFFDELPRAGEEAASLDGASSLTILREIVLPQAASGVIVTALLSFIFAWNEFPFALLLSREAARTLPVEMSTLQSQFRLEWLRMCVDGVISLLPPFVFAIIVRKYLVRGLTFGMVK
jgi:multiple sugar transport system permease protein